MFLSLPRLNPDRQLKYVGWTKGQPNNHGNSESCVLLVHKFSAWDDVPCDRTQMWDAKMTVVCERLVREEGGGYDPPPGDDPEIRPPIQRP